jgi:DNA helicase-2/ATP-dependent DNA helicase PcrA
MRFAADLHLHSRYSSAVSPAMTLENIALWAQRKGVDLLGTGDCLQLNWLRELEDNLIPAEPGLFALRPELEKTIWAKLPEHLHRSLRFVLSTEVSCAPPPKQEIQGVHYLIYFPSFESVHTFRERVAPHGDLSEGRPTLNLHSLTLLEMVKEHHEHCHLAPAHIMNPWFSALGTIGGVFSLPELFDDKGDQLLAIETGLTSTPPMCRRIPSLDTLALFSCSDAHSLDNIGRECTLLDIEPSYRALFGAIQSGARDRVLQTYKFPLLRTRYFLNWCSTCKEPFDATRCPKCQKPLVEGSRDRLKRLTSRPSVESAENAPPFRELLPLAHLIADLTNKKPESDTVKRLVQQLIDAVGHERYILTEATAAEIDQIHTPQFSRAILAQRSGSFDFSPPNARNRSLSTRSVISQATLDFGLT